MSDNDTMRAVRALDDALCAQLDALDISDDQRERCKALIRGWPILTPSAAEPEARNATVTPDASIEETWRKLREKYEAAQEAQSLSAEAQEEFYRALTAPKGMESATHGTPSAEEPEGGEPRYRSVGIRMKALYDASTGNVVECEREDGIRCRMYALAPIRQSETVEACDTDPPSLGAIAWVRPAPPEDSDLSNALSGLREDVDYLRRARAEQADMLRALEERVKKYEASIWTQLHADKREALAARVEALEASARIEQVEIHPDHSTVDGLREAMLDITNALARRLSALERRQGGGA